MKKIVKVGAGVNIIHTITRKVKPTFFVLHCLKCEHLVSHEEGKVFGGNSWRTMFNNFNAVQKTKIGRNIQIKSHIIFTSAKRKRK